MSHPNSLAVVSVDDAGPSPSQWRDAHAVCHDSGTRRLMLAVFEATLDDIRLFRLKRGAGRGRARLREAEAWVRSPDRSHVFAFLSVCDALGFDPTAIRAGLTARTPVAARTHPRNFSQQDKIAVPS